jgi:hypothetical protein
MFIEIVVEADSKIDAVDKLKNSFNTNAQFDISAEVDGELFGELGIDYDDEL